MTQWSAIETLYSHVAVYIHSAQFARKARTRQACYWFGPTALIKRHCDSVQ